MSDETPPSPESPPSRSGPPPDRDERDGEGMAWWVEVARAWGPAILAVLVLRTFVFEPFRIPSGSMIPTLLIGDQVFVTKFSYGIYAPATGVEIPFLDGLWVAPRFELLDLGDPERGDIIVFRFPKNPAQNYIKRVVAVPGDTVAVRNNRILVDGEQQAVRYTHKYEFVDDTCYGYPARHYVETIGDVEHGMLTNASAIGGRLSNMTEQTVPEGHVFVMGDNRDNSEDSRAWGFVRYDQIKGKAHFVWLSLDACEGLFAPRTERSGHGLYGAPEVPPAEQQ